MGQWSSRQGWDGVGYMEQMGKNCVEVVYEKTW
jgi:hypothetical protein